MNIIVLGPQGSGKGTQAKLLSKKLSLLHFEAGEILRQKALKDKKIEETINQKGKLVPDQIMFNIVKSFLEKNNQYTNIVFDGYPRTTKQYDILKKYLETKNTAVDLAIFLNIPKKETIRRLSARRESKKSGEIYNLITNPPPKNIALKDLIQREDDKPTEIKKRLEVYEKSTYPLINLLKKENLLKEFDGTKSIQEINKEIIKQIKKYETR